jgi:hypothetical protein
MGNPAISAEQAWKERAIAAEHKLLDYEGQPMLYSGRTELRAFKAREPLVLKVLERYNALTACALNGQSSCENEDAALFEALRQLQDWSAE